MEIQRKKKQEDAAKEKVLKNSCPRRMTEAWLIGIGEVLLKCEKSKSKAKMLPQDSKLWILKFEEHEDELKKIRSELEDALRKPDTAVDLTVTLGKGKLAVEGVSTNVMGLDAIIKGYNDMNEKIKKQQQKAQRTA